MPFLSAYFSGHSAYFSGHAIAVGRTVSRTADHVAARIPVTSGLVIAPFAGHA
jgi:hypothetical protein